MLKRPAVALQNEPKVWQQWLRRGGLCVIKVNIFSSGRTIHGITQAFASVNQPVADALCLAGDLAVYLGEVSRTTRPSSLNPKRLETHIIHSFLLQSGIFICEPEWFEDA